MFIGWQGIHRTRSLKAPAPAHAPGDATPDRAAPAPAPAAPALAAPALAAPVHAVPDLPRGPGTGPEAEREEEVAQLQQTAGWRGVLAGRC